MFASKVVANSWNAHWKHEWKVAICQTNEMIGIPFGVSIIYVKGIEKLGNCQLIHIAKPGLEGKDGTFG